jgi:hypothetical protein
MEEVKDAAQQAASQVRETAQAGVDEVRQQSSTDS